MKKIAVLLMMVMCLAGCASQRPILNTVVENDGKILMKAAGVASLVYFGDSYKEQIPDNRDRGLFALEQGNKFLLAFYGAGPLGNPRYTIASLIHSNAVLDQVVGRDLLQMVYVARLVLNKNGELTGMSWAEALLLVPPIPEAE